MQNVPRSVRDIVVAEPGHVLVQADYSAIEWCIAMWMASKHDPPGDRFHLDILDAFQEGRFDPHRHLAAIANSVAVSDVTDLQRKEAKPFTHGRTYLGWEAELARKAGLPDKVGYKVCGAHEEAFRVHPWQKEVIAFCKKHHYIQTPLGWRRYFWGVQENRKDLTELFGKYTPKPSEVIATLVSGTAADLCKVVLGSIFAGLESSHWEVLTSTHDSVMLMVPEADKGWASEWLSDQMQQPIPWLDDRSWRADIKVGSNWKEVS